VSASDVFHSFSKIIDAGSDCKIAVLIKEDAIKALEEYAELFISVIDKFINEDSPVYSEADKQVIKDSIDRHMRS